MMSLPASKGFEVGSGFEGTLLTGAWQGGRGGGCWHGMEEVACFGAEGRGLVSIIVLTECTLLACLLARAAYFFHVIRIILCFCSPST